MVAGAAAAVLVASGRDGHHVDHALPGSGARRPPAASPRAAATTASRGRGGTGDHRSRAVSPDRAGARGWEDLRMDERRPRRPALLGKVALETFGGAPDPAALAEAAHATASLLVESGRATSDEVARARLVALVDEVGLDTIADLWAQRPPRSLPGALWRLYVLREWVQRDAVAAAHDFSTGRAAAPVPHVIAGVAEPPTPEGAAGAAGRGAARRLRRRPGGGAGAGRRLLPGRRGRPGDPGRRRRAGRPRGGATR